MHQVLVNQIAAMMGKVKRAPRKTCKHRKRRAGQMESTGVVLARKGQDLMTMPWLGEWICDLTVSASCGDWRRCGSSGLVLLQGCEVETLDENIMFAVVTKALALRRSRGISTIHRISFGFKCDIAYQKPVMSFLTFFKLFQ